jgi:hypothetical protein
MVSFEEQLCWFGQIDGGGSDFGKKSMKRKAIPANRP